MATKRKFHYPISGVTTYNSGITPLIGAQHILIQSSCSAIAGVASGIVKISGRADSSMPWFNIINHSYNSPSSSGTTLSNIPYDSIHTSLDSNGGTLGLSGNWNVCISYFVE